MTDTTIITLVAAIPTTIASMAALLIGLKTAGKTTEISAKADVLHTLSNDNLSRATNALAVANETIKGLQATLATMVDAKKVADLKAFSAASKPGGSEPI